MAALTGILCCLVLAALLQPGSCLEIQSLRLVGGRGEYAEVSSGAKYKLSCTYRSGYDDPVMKVEWLLYGSPVYEWTAHNDGISASGLLFGRVDTNPESEHGSLHFTKLDYLAAGNYTCRVSSASKTVQKSYFLHVIDISPLPYDTSVHILKDLANQEENKYVAYDVESAAASTNDEVQFENAECTLVWSFKSPAIFPKPNVTCGYYSYNHDDVIHHLPAGLTMHKFMNTSWQASFEGTRVQVASIPVEHRLGCIIKIPNSTYRQLIMTEDFTVDTLIDSGGCPALEELSTTNGFIVENRDSTTNCRGHLVPHSREAPAIVTLRCPSGHQAIFSDGTAEPDWWTEISCFEYDQLWRSYHEDISQGEQIDLSELPVCDRGNGVGHNVKSSLLLTLMALTFLLAFMQNH